MTSIVKGLLPHSLLIVVSDPMWEEIQAPGPGVKGYIRSLLLRGSLENRMQSSLPSPNCRCRRDYPVLAWKEWCIPFGLFVPNDNKGKLYRNF